MSRDNDTGKDGEVSFCLEASPKIKEYFNISSEGVLTLAMALNLSDIRVS